MIAIENKLISLDVIEKDFVCNLTACKGQCCVLGDEGAPLENEESGILDDIYETVKPFLRKEGIEAIEKDGCYSVNSKGEAATTLVNGQECAFMVYDEKGVALCGIEVAHKAGAVDFKKPVSCHLYPIRINSFNGMEGINYEKWEICSPACTLGKELQVPVYRFLKEALTRKYGQAFYEQLDEIAQDWQKTC